MAFKDRISGMFRMGGGKGKAGGHSADPAGDDRDPPRLTAPEPASEEEREQLLQELSHGFVNVGGAIENLDRNLSAGTRSLETMTATQERLPALLAEQQHLIQEVAETASASRRALESLGEHLQQRDAAQAAIVDRLEALGRNLSDQRSAHREQLELVMRVHRSSRLMTAFLILGGFLLVVALLGALLYVLLGDRLGASAAPANAETAAVPTATPPSPAELPVETVADAGQAAEVAPADDDPERLELIRDASRSDDPTIARRARAALGR